jgi:hypothetical protein
VARQICLHYEFDYKPHSQAVKTAADIQEKIQSLQQELGQILDGGEMPVPFIKASRGKRKKSRKGKISAAGLANIRAGVKKRMAKLRGVTASTKPRRKMSAAGKARLSAMAKARWKKAKAAGKTAL